MQALEIIIHPRCQVYINQIQTYQYKEDKDGNALPKPIDKDDDLIDATRYALENDCFMADLPKKKTTIDDLKKMDIFDADYEELEDEIHVTYKGGNPLINNEFEKKRNKVAGYWYILDMYDKIIIYKI